MSENDQLLALKQQIKTWPNLLSFLRLLITLGWYPIIKQEYFILAFSLFLVGVLTDAADGIIARRYNQTTDFGKALDPAADKAFFLTVSRFLIPSGFIWWWRAVFGLELKLFSMGLYAFLKKIRKKEQDIFRLGANNYGKSKMVAEIVLVGELFLIKFRPAEYEPAAIGTIFGIIVGLAVLSIIGHLKIEKIISIVDRCRIKKK